MRIYCFILFFLAFHYANAQNNTIADILLPVKCNDLWTYIDTTGNIIAPPQYQYASVFYSASYAAVKKNNHYAVIDRFLKPVIPFNFDTVITLTDTTFAAGINGKYTLFDAIGKKVSEELFDRLKVYWNGYVCYQNGKCGWMDDNGIMILPVQFDRIKNLDEEKCIVSKDHALGLFSKTGKELLPILYDNISFHTDSLIRFRKKGKWGFLKPCGELITHPAWNDMTLFDPHYLKLFNDSVCALMDYHSCRIISMDYDDYYRFNNNYIIIRKKNKVGVIDFRNRIIIPPSVDEIKTCLHDYFIVKNDNRTGIMNSQGDTVVPLEYDDASWIFNQDGNVLFFLLENAGYEGIADTLGTILVPVRFDHVNILSSQFFHISLGNRYGAYSMKGKEIFPPEYEKIYYPRDNLIQAGVMNCYAIGNTDTILSDTINNHIIYENNTVKLYRDTSLEVIELDHTGDVMDRYEYFKIPVYKIANGQKSWVKYEPAIDSVTPPGPDYDFKFSHKEGLWGVYNTTTKRYEINPVFKNIYRTASPDYWLVEITSDTQYYHVGDAVFFSNRLLGVMDIETAVYIMKPEYLFIDYNKKSISIAQKWITFSQDVYGGLHRNGWFQYKRKNEKYVFIDSIIGNISRHCSGGHLTLTGYPGAYHIGKFSDYAKRIMTNYYLMPADVQTSMMLLNDSLYVECTDGNWGYNDFTRSSYNTSNMPSGLNVASNFKDGNGIVMNCNLQSGVVSSSAGYLIQPLFEGIFRTYNNNSLFFIVAETNPSYGVITENGSILFPFEYEDGMSSDNGMTALKKNGNWGLFNNEKRQITDFIYKKVNEYTDGIAAVKKGRYYGYIDESGCEAIPFRFREAFPFRNGIALVKVHTKWGYIRRTGDFLAEPSYSKAGEFSGGYAVVKKRFGYGVIDSTGKFVLKPFNKKIVSLDPCGLAIVKSFRNHFLYDLTKQKKIIGNCKAIFPVREGIVGYKKKGVCRFVSVDGEQLVDRQFSKIGPFSNGMARVWYKKKWNFIDTGGNLLSETGYDDASDYCEGVAVVNQGDSSFCIDTRGNYLFSMNKRRMIYPFRQGIAIVRETGGKVRFINKNGKPIMNRCFDEAKPFEKNIAYVKEGKKWGIINEQGDYIIHPRYYHIADFKAGKAVVVLNPLEGIADSKGKILIRPEWEKAFFVAPGIIRVEINDQVGYRTTDNRIIWPVDAREKQSVKK